MTNADRRFSPAGKPPKTVLFATPPLKYVEDTAASWAEKGFAGFIRPDIMRGWDADIWETSAGRVDGEENPLLRQCAATNSALAEHGADENFIVVPFSKHLPDWFDDDAWNGLTENLRQGARFCRMAGFRGMALDDEYIEEIFGLFWEEYQGLDNRIAELPAQARLRGQQMQRAMLDGFPDMVTIHLPESFSVMGELAKELFYGYLDVLAEKDAPGGMHLFCESSYFQTAPDWIARYGYGLDRILMDDLGPAVSDYWKRRCGISLGLSPLGYLRFIRDENGKRLGYGGRPEIFGDRIIRGGEDKSGNYGPDVFKATHAAAGMVSRKYVWVFSGGPAWWQMSDEERAKYDAPDVDTVPVTENFDEYAATLQNPSIIDEPLFTDMGDAMRERASIGVLDGLGLPPVWWITGPFENQDGRGWNAVHISETMSNLRLEVKMTAYQGPLGPVPWQQIDTPPTGYVDLSRSLGGGSFVQGYAVAWVDVEQETECVLRFGSDDTAKIWFNGKIAHESNTERINIPDEDTIPLTLPAGRSQFLLKIGNYNGGYGFYFRITDVAGGEMPGLSWVTDLSAVPPQL
jgi:hypothetical protein